MSRSQAVVVGFVVSAWLTLIAILAIVLIFVRLTGFMKLLADKEGR